MSFSGPEEPDPIHPGPPISQWQGTKAGDSGCHGTTGWGTGWAEITRQLKLKLKLQYFGHLVQRADSVEKTLMLGKIEGKREGGNRGWDGWMASPTQWTWVWASSGSLVMDREGWHAAAHGVTKSRTQLTDWTTTHQVVRGRMEPERMPWRSSGTRDVFAERKETVAFPKPRQRPEILTETQIPWWNQKWMIW